MIKKFARSKLGQALLSRVIALFIKLLSYSIFWKNITPSNKEDIFKNHTTIIVVFWHERIAVMSKIWPKERKLAMLQSPHPDGRLIASAINKLGFLTVWGSTNRNAVGGILGLVKIAKKGVSIGITPDGPRGPALVCSPGPIAVARLSGLPIVPIAWSCSKFWKLNTWDNSILPKPFSKGVWVWGKPIYVDKNSSKKDIKLLTEQLSLNLNKITSVADNYFNT